MFQAFYVFSPMLRISILLPLLSLIWACQDSSSVYKTESQGPTSPPANRLEDGTPVAPRKSTRILILSGQIGQAMPGVEMGFYDYLPAILQTDGHETEVQCFPQALYLGQEGDQNALLWTDSIQARAADWLVLAFGWDECWESSLSTERFRAELQQFIQEIDHARSKVIYLTPGLPPINAPQATQERANQLARAIREVAVQSYGGVADIWNFYQSYDAMPDQQLSDLFLDQP
jgi:hypothetical protein